MSDNRQQSWPRVAVSLVFGSLVGCNVVIGLNKMSVQTTSTNDGGSSTINVVGCQSNAECTEQATVDAIANSADAGTPGAVVPAMCIKPEGRCANLLSDDCGTVTGDYSDDRAIIIGSLFALQGTTTTQNIPRQQSAMLAVEEIDAAGGIPTSTTGNARPLVMVSCDTTANLVRAATHLVSDLNVPAIVGPNTSQDTLDVSNKVTIQAGVVVMSPTAVAASIADLLDNDKTWLMQPTDDQRGPLMIRDIGDVEAELKVSRNASQIKLSIIYRNDALGVGTRTSLDALVINGKPLSDATNAGGSNGNVHVVPYDAKQSDFGPLLSKEVAFAPDIVVLAGTAETVIKVMTPLEQQWTAGATRPYYYLIDPSKGPELLAAVTGNDDLRRRVRGTGIKPGPGSVAVSNTFNLDYLGRYGGAPTASGTGTSYDATYAIAYALAATKDIPVSGSSIAQGLRSLSGGTVRIETGTQNLLEGFHSLASGQTITGIGTNCPLEWDQRGNVTGGTIDMWCIGNAGGTPAFQSSGLTFDIKTQTYAGSYTQCGP